jgi:hypothetical protein
MKLWIISLAYLIWSGMLLAQEEISYEEVIEHDLQSFEVPASGELSEVKLLSANITLSTGFVNSEFEDVIDVVMGSDFYEIELKTEYPRALQFTVSDMEGIIFNQGRFVGQKSIDFERRLTGRYAIYLFAGTTVVKAFTVEKHIPVQAAF